MKLELKGDFLKSDALKGKQGLLAIGLIVVIVGVAGWLLYTNVFAGSGGDQPAPIASGAPTDPSGAPVAAPSPGGPVTPGTPAGAPSPETAPATAAAPSPAQAPTGQPAPASPTPSAGQSAPAAAPRAAAAPAASQPASAKSAPSAAPRTIKVFGSVTVTYPNTWGVGMGEGSSAVISDGKGRFEIHAPDPKASDAKSIAGAAVCSIAGKGPSVSMPQGELKISGYGAYFYVVGGKKIVGIDAPTRIVLVECAKGAQFSAYAAAFDKMQADLKFQ